MINKALSVTLIPINCFFLSKFKSAQKLESLDMSDAARRNWGGKEAICLLKGFGVNNSNIKGEFHFRQLDFDQPTYVKGQVKGLKPESEFNLVVYTCGDHTNAPASLGAPFKPDSTEVDDPIWNITSNDKGLAHYEAELNNFAIMNKYSSMGRTLTLLNSNEISIDNIIALGLIGQVEYGKEEKWNTLKINI